MLEIRLLGQFDVRRDGLPVEIASRPAQALLAYLALNAGRPIRREKLAGLLWPDSSEENARTYLRQALWRVRKAIGESYLPADRMTVSFEPDEDCRLDAAMLEEEPATGWSAESLIEAVAPYQGDLLPGFYEEWVTLERERLRALYERRMDQLVELLAGAARWGEILNWAERWIAMGGAPEPAYRALMQAHASAGNLTSVKSVYQRCAMALEEELGVAPSKETTTLYQRLISGERPDPALKPQRTPEELQDPSSVEPPFMASESQRHPADAKPFIGKTQELAQLREYLDHAVAGQGRLIFVTGEAGQGKTTLLHEFARRSQEAIPELIVASGACPIYTSVNAPYGIFRDVLGMLTADVEPAWAAGTIDREQALRLWRFLPETVSALLDHGPHLVDAMIPAGGLLQRFSTAAPNNDQAASLNDLIRRSTRESGRISEQGELFAEYAAFLTALAAKRPLLLILDDLHWADASSIGLLGYLSHRLTDNRILMLSAVRLEEISQARGTAPHPLAQIMGEYKRRFGEVVLELEEANESEGRAFIDDLLDTEPNALDARFREDLARHTAGHPLFTIELLREMQERGTLYHNKADRWIVKPDFHWDLVPPRVEGVIETRINRLEPELRQWLETASVEGSTFTAEVVAHTHGIDEREVVRRMSRELDRTHRLVSAQEIRRVDSQRLSRYRFRHILFRHYLYTGLDDIERCYLHEQVGAALEKLYGGQTHQIAEKLSHHYQNASQPEKALTYLTQAGEAAAAIYAYEEAISFFSQTLTELKKQDSSSLGETDLISLFTKLGRNLEHHSEFNQALVVYKEMEELGRTRASDAMILAALVAQGTLHAVPTPLHNPRRAEEISVQALDIAQQLRDKKTEARVLWNLMFAYEYGEQLEMAIENGERSLALARELDLREQLPFTLNDLAGCYWVGGQLDRGLELFQEAIDLRRALEDRPMLADVLHASSIACMFAGKYDMAIARSEESWQISKSIDNKWGLTSGWSRMGFVYRERGELGKAIKLTKDSLNLAKVHDFRSEYVIPNAELAFLYADLVMPSRGLEFAQQALNASETVPGYRPYAFAAVVQCQLRLGELSQAEKTIEQARNDPSWQSWPAYCFALLLAEAQLALAKADYERALDRARNLAEDLRQSGIGSYLPAALDVAGQSLFALDRSQEARATFLEAKREAEAMEAKTRLWPVLLHLSQTDSDPVEAARLLEDARALVAFIADRTGSEALRASFLSLPEVKQLQG